MLYVGQLCKNIEGFGSNFDNQEGSEETETKYDKK